MDLYKVLQVDRGADVEVIEAAYRRLARKFHPDVSSSADAGTRMRELNEAYGVLKDRERRRAYDSRPRWRRVRIRRRRRDRRAPEVRRSTIPAPRPTRKSWRSGLWSVRQHRAVAAACAGLLVAAIGIGAGAAQLIGPAMPEEEREVQGGVVVVMTQHSPPEQSAAPSPRPTAEPPAGWPPTFDYAVSGETIAEAPRLLWPALGRAYREVERRLAGPRPPDGPKAPERLGEPVGIIAP